MAELNEKENVQVDEELLKQIAGGMMPNDLVPFAPYNCQLTGLYWTTTFAPYPPNNLLVGQVMQVVYNPGAQGICKYQLMRGGEYMGWTIRDNFTLVKYPY